MFFKDKCKGITVLIARVWLVFCCLNDEFTISFRDSEFNGFNGWFVSHEFFFFLRLNEIELASKGFGDG